MDGFDAFYLLSGFLSVAVFIVPVVLVLGLVVILALRSDSDADGRRPYAIYLALASYVALFTLLFASFAAVNSIVDVVSDEGGDSVGVDVELDDEFEDEFDDDFEFVPQDNDDGAWNAFAISLIVGAVAGAILVYHHPRLSRLAPAPYDGSAHWRAVQAYRLVVCFTTVVIVLASLAIALYGVFQAAAPGVSGVGDRGDAAAKIVRAGYFALASGFVFFWHMGAEGTMPASPRTSGFEPPPPPPPQPRTDVG